MKRGFIIVALGLLFIFSFALSVQGLHLDEHSRVVEAGVSLKKDVHGRDLDGGK